MKSFSFKIALETVDVHVDMSGPSDIYLWNITREILESEYRNIDAVFFGAGSTVNLALTDAVNNLSKSIAHSHLRGELTRAIDNYMATSDVDGYAICDAVAKMFCMLSIGKAKNG